MALLLNHVFSPHIFLNSVQYSPSRKAEKPLTWLRNFWNPKILYRVNENSSLKPALRQVDLVHIFKDPF
jgi:hypothetical protein